MIEAILPELVVNFRVIHQTGELDFAYFRGKASRNYRVYDFIPPEKLPAIFREADIIISRAGANTVSEILVTGRPSILIPIPWTIFDEQNKNAHAAKASGIAEVVSEAEATPEKLLRTLEAIVTNWQEMVTTYKRDLAELDAVAAKRVVKILTELT